MDKLKLTLTFVIIIGVIALGFYWLSKDADKSKSDTLNAIKRGYKYSKGIISDMHSYKGRTLEVKYRINGVYYDCIRNWDTNPRHLNTGDSILLKYATDNPELIVTELEDSY